MESRFEPEQTRTEPRFHPDTVQKAVSLAQRLQNERRDTLSLAEIDQIASEIGIDPSILRHALNAIAEKEAKEYKAAEAVLGQMTAQNHQMTAQSAALQKQRRTAFVLIATGMVGATLLSTLLFGMRSEQESVMPPTPPTVASPPALLNGDFEKGPARNVAVPEGSTLIPGWTVVDGPVTYRRQDASGGRSGLLELGPGGAACVQQLFPTQPGQQYRLTVRVSGIPKSVASMSRVQLIVGDSSTSVAAFTPAKSVAPPQWVGGELTFTAAEPGTIVKLLKENQSGEEGAPVIDDVSLFLDRR